jgi:hypothetical protein
MLAAEGLSGTEEKRSIGETGEIPVILPYSLTYR